MNKEDYKENYSEIRVIGFDADDTLWVNETFFREAEDQFCKMLSSYETENKLRQILLSTELKNLDLYGYGIKGFILSLIEAAGEVSDHKLGSEMYEQILELGKTMLKKPVDLLEGVEETLKYTSEKYRILLLTKGDLLDQERKLKKSGLSRYFHHVEVLSNKYSQNYQELLDHLSIEPSEFLMIGNSLKSDVLPLLEIGAKAIHIPFHTTWEHEMVHEPIKTDYLTLKEIRELKNLV